RSARPERPRGRLPAATCRVPASPVSGQPVFPHAGDPRRRSPAAGRARPEAGAADGPVARGRRGCGGPAMRMTTVDTSSSTDRDELVIAHVGLVKVMAHRLAQRLPSQVEMSDLISVGVLGLIDAAGRYRPAMGVPFDAFARRRVQGAMLDALRDLDWAPRSLRRLRRDIDSAPPSLRPSLKPGPMGPEIATMLETSPDQIT